MGFDALTTEQPTREQIEDIARALHRSEHGSPSCACHSFGGSASDHYRYIRLAKIAVSAYREALSHA